ncbi:MAG TPA: winged helix-turn-helix transcriptional regulator [Nitrososphaeraceae archaeon]|nr:winged helix-turn-helix transcriptional regulator [Nitrososphaeraceae archaeon]
MRKKPSNSNQERILSFIQDNPGCYLRQIRNELALSMGSVQYHSYQLQKVGKITSTRQGLYKLHFQSGTFQDHEKKIFQVLNQETPREIIMFIIEQKDPTQTEITKRLGISAPSINWHVRRLIDFKIVDEVRDGKYKRYKLSDNSIDSRYIVEVLKTHHPNLWNKWSNRLAEMFLSLSDEDK